MGLFDAKYCDICGNKLGLLGTTKLEDGHLCKDCTSRLSPYISRRHQNLAFIKEHLAYRDRNKAKLSALNITKSYGDAQKIWIDESSRKFVISRSADFSRTNPDIFSFDDVVSIEKQINEDSDELFTKDEQGNKVSYDPPRYEYESSFVVKMAVRNADIDSDIRVELFGRKESEVLHDEAFMERNALTNEAINTIRPGTITEEFFETSSAAPADTAAKRYVCYIRCASCGALIEGPAIPRFCPECADPITLADIGVIDTETGDILV